MGQNFSLASTLATVPQCATQGVTAILIVSDFIPLSWSLVGVLPDLGTVGNWQLGTFELPSSSSSSSSSNQVSTFPLF